MIKISTMPIGTLSEILLYLSENGKFSSIEKLCGGVKVAEVRAALRELSKEILREAVGPNDVDHIHSYVSPNTKEVISSLSVDDKNALLSAFKSS